MLQSLGHTRTLWISFIATIVITFLFPVVGNQWGISFIDAISDPEQVRAAIAGFTPEQRIVHVWVTATLDVAYPLAYGALFIGSAYCFYGRFGQLAKILGIAFVVLIATDLLEGVVQVLALTDTVDWVDAKAVLTPLKTILFLGGFAITVIGWVMWVIQRARN